MFVNKAVRRTMGYMHWHVHATSLCLGELPQSKEYVQSALTDQHESDYFVGYLCITFLSIIILL